MSHNSCSPRGAAIFILTEKGEKQDEGCQTLVDLAEAYARHASRQAFDAELRNFMTGHGRRKSLVQRLVKAKVMRCG